MNEEAICPKCHGALPAGGLCPRCAADFLQAAPTEISGESHSFSPPRPEDLARLFPQLDIIELIGRGGMGAVYKARQKELDRMVALKILPPGIGQDSGFAERFAREAKALAKLNHQGIVTIYDFGRADGLYFFLMEYVDGVNLKQLLDRGRISPREALAIVPQICDALQFAHDQGIVHRDIKPENILLDRRGRVKVADFGLAKIIASDGPSISQTGAASPEGAAPGSALTEGGKILGTPAYMAPEQVKHPEAVDHRADIYALGMVFYQMLTGQLPASPIEPPSRKIQIDVRLDEVVLRALEKNPETRYQQASVLKTQVETIVATPSNPVAVQTHLQPSLTKVNRNTDKSIWPWAVSAGVAVCLLALGLATFHKTDSRLGSKVKYTSEQASVQDIVQNLAEQVGLRYDWQKSFDQTDPLCRRWVFNVAIEGKTCDEALEQVLKPVGLRYQVEKGVLVLSRQANAIAIPPNDAGSYHRRGDAKQDKNDFDGAIADYTKGIELNPHDVACYYRRGDAKQEKKDWEGAIADYTKAIGLKPDDAGYYHRRGDAKQGKNDLEGAIADYTKAIELKPDDADSYHRRGDAKQDRNDWEGAIADYTKAIELQPDDPDYSYHRRGDAKQGKNDLEGAIADYTKAIEVKPDDAGSYHRRGDAKQGKNDLDDAIADYTKAIELKPDDAGSYHQRGDAKRSKGDLEGAIADYSKAIELKPEDASSYLNRSLAKKAKGDVGGAAADHTKAIELRPDLESH